MRHPLKAYFCTRFIIESPASYVLNFTLLKFVQPANISSEIYQIFDGSMMLVSDVQFLNTAGYT